MTWHDILCPALPSHTALQIAQNGEMNESQFNTGGVPLDVGSGLVFAGGQYLAVWSYPWPTQVVVTVVRELPIIKSEIHNFVRLQNNYVRCDLVGDMHGYSIECSTNLVDWVAAGGAWNIPLFWPGSCVWYDPIPGPGRRFYRANDGSITCLTNRRRIQAAKAHWALEHSHADNNDVPLWSQLVGPGKYLPTQPVCPNGGAYSIERVVTYPWCTANSSAGHNKL